MLALKTPHGQSLIRGSIPPTLAQLGEYLGAGRTYTWPGRTPKSRTSDVEDDQLRKQLLALPSTQRAELAHLLIESLNQDSDTGSEEAWNAELTRRAAQIRSGGVVGHDADEVFDGIRQKYP